jgi:hypothetical protein
MSDEKPSPEINENEAADRAGAGDRSKKKQMVGAGVAVGIGSAAIVAALLYAKSSRRKGE